jgi:hypothetical protein
MWRKASEAYIFLRSLDAGQVVVLDRTSGSIGHEMGGKVLMVCEDDEGVRTTQRAGNGKESGAAKCDERRVDTNCRGKSQPNFCAGTISS